MHELLLGHMLQNSTKFQDNKSKQRKGVGLATAHFKDAFEGGEGIEQTLVCPYS